jgi:hypothetical protein
MNPKDLARGAVLLALLGGIGLLLACPAGDDDDDAGDDGDDDADDDSGDNDADDDDDADIGPQDDDADDDSGDDDSDGGEIVGTKRTDCKDGSGGGKDGDDWPQSLAFLYADGVLGVTHVNGRFNCCLERIDVALEQAGYALDLQETEYAPAPCFCECPYDVTTRIAGLAPGTYVVSAYANGTFAVSGEVTIP